MAILYILEMNHPNDVTAFPPSIVSSEWLTNLNNYYQSKTDSELFGALIRFSDRTELDTFLTNHTLRDAGLLADLNSWKTAHNVSFNNKFYYTIDSVPPDGTDPTGLLY